MPLTANACLNRPVTPDAVAIVDGDFTTFVARAGPASGNWTIDLQRDRQIVKMRWKTWRDAGTSASLQYWNPLTSQWVTVDTLPTGVIATVDRTISFDPPINTNQLRVSYSIEWGYNIAVYEVQAYTADPIPAELVFTDATDVYDDTEPFGNVIAGDTLGPKEVRLYNNATASVQAPSVWAVDKPIGDVIELSKTADPFIPDDPLVFSGTFAPGALIGSVYVRIKPPITSPGGQKSFRLRARATPV